MLVIVHPLRGLDGTIGMSVKALSWTGWAGALGPVKSVPTARRSGAVWGEVARDEVRVPQTRGCSGAGPLRFSSGSFHSFGRGAEVVDAVADTPERELGAIRRTHFLHGGLDL